jgi:hypothetical protein
MIVATILNQRFELLTRNSPGYDIDGAVTNAYERFAGHLGLGPVD